MNSWRENKYFKFSNRFKIQYSTAKSLFDELKHSSSDELTEKVLNNWKHRFEDSLKEYVEIC